MTPLAWEVPVSRNLIFIAAPERLLENCDNRQSLENDSSYYRAVEVQT